MIHISDVENLDVIFLFYMKSVIRKLKYGVEGLKADIQNVDENVVSYISKGLDLIRCGYTPKEIRLNYQLDFYIENIPKDKLELDNY